MTKLDQETVWKSVREIRGSFLFNQNDLECNFEQTLLSNYFIIDHVKGIEEKLKLNATSDQFEKVSEKSFKHASEIFAYLNYCPPKLYNFIKKFKKSSTPKDILLALTSIEKSAKNANKRSSDKIFKKAMEILKLDNYKKINKITIEDGYDNCMLDNHVDSCKQIIAVLGKTI